MRADTLARAATLDRSELAYIVPFDGPDGVHDHHVTWSDLARDAAWVERALSAHGLGAGDTAVLTFSGFEGPWLRPLIDATRSLGVTYGITEAMGWDHGRTRVFQRELRPKAVIGLSEATVEGLSGTVVLEEFFRDTAVVLARPEAARQLRAAGVPTGVIALVGPLLAMECPERNGAHYDASRWSVVAHPDHLDVSAVGDDEAASTPIRVPVRAGIAAEPCACGSADPRVLL